MVVMRPGDLFKASEDILAHGVNCRGAFGSGVAYWMVMNHRKAQEAYFEKYNTEGWRLGDVQFVASNKKMIANCATQYNYLPRGQQHVDYEAIKICMTKVKEFAKGYGKTVAIPKIGSGLAGGNWETILQILEEVFTDYDVSVYVLE